MFCRRLYILPAMLFFLAATAAAGAGEIEPRAYANTPVGINFLILGYSVSEGGLSTEASSPIKDARLRIHSSVLACARSLDVWGKSGKIDLILPYSRLSGTATVKGLPAERNVGGFHDPRLRFSVNLYGAPALSLKEFADYRQDLIVGASLQVSAPLGQYDEGRLVNLGNNRWYVKPDLGISKAWGPLVTEFSAGVFWFSENREYFGGQTLRQDPLYTAQVHAAYHFGRGPWAALSATYDYGGRTTVDGVRNPELESNWRGGATIALPLHRNHSIKLYASSGVHTRIGNDYRAFGVAWQIRWGAGL
ncbi:MAG: transporter [Thermodesulfobacteriota bacterium]